MRIGFITSFKPFKDRDYLAQMSALYSWCYIRSIIAAPESSPEDTLQLKGVKTGRDLGFETDAPIVPSLILRALEVLRDCDVLVLINSDILVTPDFSKDLEKTFNKYGRNIFLTGTRFNINLDFMVDSLQAYDVVLSLPRTIYDEFSSSDIFIGTPKMFSAMAEEMPEFVLGRYAWDNWIHFYAQNHLNKLNCTHALPILHCDHDKSHIKTQEGFAGRRAPSSMHNLGLLRPLLDTYGPTVRINRWPKVILD